MTQLDQREAPAPPDEGEPKRRGHGHWMMIACCIPMLVIAVVLVATGVVGAGFIVVAVACTVMMAMMMRGMSNGGAAGITDMPWDLAGRETGDSRRARRSAFRAEFEALHHDGRGLFVESP